MGKLILMVDDEPDFLTLVSFRLKKAGYEIITAGDGEEGFKLAQANKPDLILLDLKMPKVSGEETCRKIKSDPGLKNIPVIFFTASRVGYATQIALELGAQGCILKPFDPEDLLSKIKQTIEKN